MIPDIKELNFPSYATLHQANVSLADMGDRTITAQVKIDGEIRPEFIGTDGEDWVVEFKGEKYIQPLRNPQAEKNNESRYSLVDLTFYHWAIYQLKRYYFVSLANTESGTAIADKYIVPLTVNLENFARALADILKFYFPEGEIYVYTKGGRYVNPDATGYDTQVKTIDISYTYIWELLQKTQELYDCRWAMELDADGNYAIKFGYDPGYIDKDDHTFQYGYEGGLLKFERQVQDADIRNQILGRGGEQNLPYLYFKDYEKFHPNSTDGRYSNYGQIPDPDAIPELENVLFENLRDSNFRSYVQGWKTNPKRQLTTTDGWVGTVETYDTERAKTDWAYKKGHEDKKFDPVEYVKDDESIATYGLLQGGLDNQEDIYPSLQGLMLELPCAIEEHGGHEVETLADEVVAVEEVETDEIDASTGSAAINKFEIASEVGVLDEDASIASKGRAIKADSVTFGAYVQTFTVPEGYRAYILPRKSPKAWMEVRYMDSSFGLSTKSSANTYDTFWQRAQEYPTEASAAVQSFTIYSSETGEPAPNQTSLAPGRYFARAVVKIDEFTFHVTPVLNSVKSVLSCEMKCAFTAEVFCYNFDGTVLDNDSSASHTVASGEDYTFNLGGIEFDVPESGALMIEVPVEVTPKEWALTEVSTRVYRVSDGEEVNNADIPEGRYRTLTLVKVTNLDRDASHEFKASLLPTYLYYSTATAQWQPTFDIWVKNIFETDRSQYEGGDAGDAQYVAAVWEPLVTSQEMAVTFTTGNLSASSDWEFKLATDGIHYDNSKTIIIKDEDNVEHEIRSEWRLTLIKSEAEADAIHKYVPYKDYNAKQGDRIFLTGIYLPWSYVYAAEKELTATKEAELNKTKEVQPTWVVTLDKLRINTIGEGETKKLIDRIHVGDHIWVGDPRFAPEGGLELYVTSMTYDWQEGAMLPDIEIVLSDEITASLSPVEQLQSSVEVMSNQLKALANIERTVRTVGDAVYLRKDGVTDTTYSETRIAKTLQSKSFRTGIIGGEGWGAYTDMDGRSVLEVDRLLVRRDMQVNNLVANQISAMGGKEILSAASIQISQVEQTEDGIVCYFEQHDGTVGNLFTVGDIAMSQKFDTANEEIKYYRRVVTAVGNNFVTLSLNQVDGDGATQAGDTLVQFGNIEDTSRQYVIIRDVIGGGYEQMLSGLDSVTASGKEYFFAGGRDLPDTELEGLLSSEGRQLADSNGNLLYTNYRETTHHITPRWFVGDSDSEYAEYKNGELSIKGRLSVLKSDGTYQPMAEYINQIALNEKNLQDQIDGAIQTWAGDEAPTLSNYPASSWTDIATRNNHIGDLYYETNTGHGYRFMYTEEGGFFWLQLTDEDVTAALARLDGMQYLERALVDGSTVIEGGLVLTNLIQLGQTEAGVFNVYSGINGQLDSARKGEGIAAWYGGPMGDKEDGDAIYAKSLFRFDGSGYLAGGNIAWGADGNGRIPGISWNNGVITFDSGIKISGGDESLASIVEVLTRLDSYFEIDDNGDLHVREGRGIWSDSFLAAGGAGSGGSSLNLVGLGFASDTMYNPTDSVPTFIAVYQRDGTTAIYQGPTKTSEDGYNLISMRIRSEVVQMRSTSNADYPVAIAGKQFANMTSGNCLPIYYNNTVTLNPSTGTLKVNDIVVNGKSIAAILSQLGV